MTNSKIIEDYYGKWWENPEDTRSMIFGSLNKLVKERIPMGVGKKALDLGAGRGTITEYLLKKGYETTAVDLSDSFCQQIVKKLPKAHVIRADVLDMVEDPPFVECTYDLVTCIELLQNLRGSSLVRLLKGLHKITKKLIINISNRNSFHSWWLRKRGWKNDFVYHYKPDDFEEALISAGFKITYRKGIGLLTPVSSKKGFKNQILPTKLVKLVNRLDRFAMKHCHLYYIEAESGK